MFRTSFVSMLLFFCANGFAQEMSKDCFDHSGKPAEETDGNYCVVGKKVFRIDEYALGQKDTVISYVDTVRAYFTATNKIKFLKIYNKEGYEDGNYVEYYPNGKIQERGSYKMGVKSGYITSYFSNGKPKGVLQFFPIEEKISDASETNFKILSYKDSIGNQLIKNGDGFCSCYLISGRREVGKISDGLRDSVWSEYSGDTLILREEYSKGKLLKGVRFHKGIDYSYNEIAEFPEYSEGYDGMMQVIRKNMTYPVSARRAGIDGTVMITFIVTQEGNIKNVRVGKGIGSEDCDNEALRVVKLLEKWTPARFRGRPEALRYNLPIKFKLN